MQVSATVGKAYGHYPGNHYHDVHVYIKRKPSGRWVVGILDSWGCNQGDDQKRGRKCVIGRGVSLDAALEQAAQLASEANINQEYLAQSLSQAASNAEEVLETELKVEEAIP